MLACALPIAANAQVQSRGEPAQRIDIVHHVREASQQFGIPERWILAVIRIESAGQVRAVSSAGAMGLMQLMPGTWIRQRARFGLGNDPFDPRDNILAGTSYLREMHDRYGLQGFLAAYNAGPGRYEDWLAGRRSLPIETRRYVAKIAPFLQADRMFVAAAAHDTRELGVLDPRAHPAKPDRLPASDSERRTNPFARPATATHDLFAPVTTADQR